MTGRRSCTWFHDVRLCPWSLFARMLRCFAWAPRLPCPCAQLDKLQELAGDEALIMETLVSIRQL